MPRRLPVPPCRAAAVPGLPAAPGPPAPLPPAALLPCSFSSLLLLFFSAPLPPYSSPSLPLFFSAPLLLFLPTPLPPQEKLPQCSPCPRWCYLKHLGAGAGRCYFKTPISAPSSGFAAHRAELGATREALFAQSTWATQRQQLQMSFPAGVLQQQSCYNTRSSTST